MILYFPQGQLGNQIFQYMFLKNIGPGQRIYSSGFGQLIEVFYVDDVTNFRMNKNRFMRRVRKSIKAILGFLAAWRVIACIEVNSEILPGHYKREKTDYRKTTGLFNRINYVRSGFFQSEEFFVKEDARKLRIREVFRQQADQVVAKCPGSAYLVFVHIRLGDYRKHKVLGKSVQLPTDYYWKQINRFMDRKPNCFFIFMSDEPGVVQKEFESLANKMVSQGKHFGTDFALMTRCNGAILAPSSFGWWGAYLMENRDQVFAPRHWLGFNSGVDYHSKPIPEIFTQVEIAAGEGSPA